MKKILQNKTENIFALMVSIISAASFSMYYDVNLITTWGWTFLDCVKTNRISSYAEILASNNCIINYSFVICILLSLWMAPPYIFSLLTKTEISFLVRSGWYKILLLIAVFICISQFRKTLQLLGYNKKVTSQVILLFVATPFVQWSCLAHGQIDIFGVIFLLCGINSLLKKEYEKTAVFFSLSLLVKGIALFFIAPILLLAFGKDLKQLIKILFMMCIVPTLSYGIGEFLVNDYNFYMHTKNSQDFIPRLFATSVNDTSILLLLVGILLFVCFYRSVKEAATFFDYIVFPVLVFLIPTAMIFWHPQWMIYSLCFLLILGTLMDNKVIFHLLYFFMNIGFLLYVNTNELWSGLSNVMIINGTIPNLISHLFHVDLNMPLYIGDVIGVVFDYGKSLSRTIFVLCMMLIVGVSIYEHMHHPKEFNIQEYMQSDKLLLERAEIKEQKGLIIIQFLPITVLIFISYYYLFL